MTCGLRGVFRGVLASCVMLSACAPEPSGGSEPDSGGFLGVYTFSDAGPLAPPDPVGPIVSMPIGGSAGTASGTSGTSGQGGAAGSTPPAAMDAGVDAAVPVSQSALFVPDLPNTYAGTDTPQLLIVASTIGEGSLGHEWLVAVENVSVDLILCTGVVHTTFFDAAGAELATSFGPLQSPVRRGCDGTCGFMSCIGPGEIGMALDRSGINDVDVSAITRMEHTFSGLNIIDAVPTTDLAVSGIQIVENSFGSNAFRGTLHNNTTETLDDPEVWVFGLTAAGRPLAGAEDSSALSISSFGTVSFETGGFQAAAADITDFVAYPFARLP